MFIVFEGIDGSGKTTVSNRVAERLRALGLAVKHLRAEGKFASSVTEAIRALGRDAKNLDLAPQAEFLLYVARDVQLIEEALRPALLEHDVVIADRFLYTAEVLACYGRRLSREWAAPVLHAAANQLLPDLVVLVDVDPVLARARRKAYKLVAADSRPPSRKGLAGVGLQHRLRRGYLELANSQPERWVVVDNEQNLDDTVKAVTQLIATGHARGVEVAIEQHRARVASYQGKVAPPDAPRSTAEALELFLGWLDRRSEREPQVAAYLLSGLSGPGVDEQRRALAERVPGVVLAGLRGLLDPVSWEIRRQLTADYPALVARSLRGLPNADERVFELRVELEPRVPAEVAASLTRQDDEAAWATRERMFTEFPDEVVRTLVSLGSERAWDLRTRWLEPRKDRLSQEYEVASTAAHSVGGLGDDRAWKTREKARAAAPVAALASINGLVDDRSWRWREQHLSRATKVVMGTLWHMSHPRAWEMRKTVARDCKEAVDSLANLNDPEAWELRDDCRDIWPSTVVKSLGPLADEPRGRELLERQLRVYPSNISLLKHASAIALGNHRTEPQKEIE
jgi:dTMP kinase